MSAQDPQAEQLSMAGGFGETMATDEGIGGDLQAVLDGEGEGVAVASGGEQDAEEDDNNQYASAEAIMPGIRDDNEMHNTVDEGFDSFYTSRRGVHVEIDDVDVVIDNQKWYAQQVFDAITTKPAQTNAKQDDDLETFLKPLNKFHTLYDAKAFLINISAMVVKAVIRLHASGDHLYRAQFLALNPDADDYTMPATQRLRTVCEILQGNKKVASDIMSGADQITILVAAPLGLIRVKGKYKKSKDTRAQAAKDLKRKLEAFEQGIRAEEAAEGATEEAAEENAEEDADEDADEDAEEDAVANAVENAEEALPDLGLPYELSLEAAEAVVRGCYDAAAKKAKTRDESGL